jgi:hypothetical protein
MSFVTVGSGLSLFTSSCKQRRNTKSTARPVLSLESSSWRQNKQHFNQEHNSHSLYRPSCHQQWPTVSLVREKVNFIFQSLIQHCSRNQITFTAVMWASPDILLLRGFQ